MCEVVYEFSAENMAEFRMGGVIGIQKDKLGSPSTGSEDGGGVDLAELVQELDHDEFDGPTVLNGNLCELLHAHWHYL